MATQIRMVPSGTGGDGKPVAGSILGYATYPDGQTFDNQAFVDANIAAVELPSGVNADPTLIGGRVTAIAAGAYGNTTYADESAFNSDLTPLPEKYLNNPNGEFVFFTGNGYTTVTGVSLGEPLTLSITNAGLGYTIGTGVTTAAITGNGRALTVEITSVGGNGEITGVTVDDAGAYFEVNDTVSVIGGDGSAVLTIGSLDAVKIGQINSGRGASNQASANDINPSYFPEPPLGLTEAELELYIPSSDQILSYDATLPSPYKFDSLGDCFVGGDFTVQVRIAENKGIIAEFECPGPQDVNSDIDLGAYVAP